MKQVIFVNNMVCPLLLLSGKKGKNMIKVTKIITIKNIKNTKKTLLNLMIFMLKRRMFPKNMINKCQVKVNILLVENLVISVKIAIKNLVCSMLIIESTIQKRFKLWSFSWGEKTAWITIIYYHKGGRGHDVEIESTVIQ